MAADRLSTEVLGAYEAARLTRARAENDALLADADRDASDGRGRVLGFIVFFVLGIVAVFSAMIYAGHAGAVWAGSFVAGLFS